MICRLWSSYKLKSGTLNTYLTQLTNLTGVALMALPLILSNAGSGFASIDAAATDEYFEFLARANDYSPLEHGGSHGTIGFGVGVGLAGYSAPTNSDVMREHWRGANQPVSQSQTAPLTQVVIPRFQIHKGLPGSIDVGGGFGKDAFSKATLASGYMQWTIYEGFAMPAFAVRGGYNRVLGLATTDASSVTMEGVASYGFLRILTLYGTMGAGRHQIEVRSGAGFGSVMSLNGEYEDTVSRVLFRKSRSVGLKVQIIPALCDVSIESKRTGDAQGSYLAKISVGM